MRKSRRNNNAFQVSWASWDRSAAPLINLPDLLNRWVDQLGGTNIRLVPADQPHRTSSAEFSAEGFAYCRAWCITYGDNVINATFICDALPTDEELEEVTGIAENLTIKQRAGKRWFFF